LPAALAGAGSSSEAGSVLTGDDEEQFAPASPQRYAMVSQKSLHVEKL
jgi:hypothetical protein